MAIHEPCTMGDLLIRSVQRGGERVAFISGDRPIRYSEFGRRLSQVVQALSARGVRRGGAMACLSSNSLEAFLIVAAGYLMGARVTNLHPLGSAEDHAFILKDCGASVLAFDADHYLERALDVHARTDAAFELLALGPCDRATDLMAQAARFEPQPLVAEAQADDICWLIYTGGTTGRPKGVIHTHRTHMALTMAELSEWEWPSRICFLAITPISHGAGACIMPALLRSGTVVMDNGFSPAKFLETVSRHQVTSTFLVPTMIYKLLDHLIEVRDGGADARALIAPCLQTMIYGAAPMSPTRMVEALAWFGPVFMQLYGQTEAPNCVTVLRKADHDPEHHPTRITSCGVPIFSSQVQLLDEHDRPVADGVAGEICVRGPLVAGGYWNRPAETAATFRDGWLHTGDLARRDADGFLYIVGRSKDMIISGGFNVYPAEIEDVLTSHPAVSAAAVIGVADATWGEAVKAVLVLRPGQTVTPAEIIALVRDAKGPIYAPKTVSFIDALPVTALGKPDKKALRARFSEGG